MSRRPWRRCSACGGVCHWHLDAWVCDGPDGCGSEWYEDHDPRFAAPGEEPPPFYAARNDTDSDRYGQELWGVRPRDGRGWCALTYGIPTSMMSTREQAEADAARLNAIAAAS